MVVPEGFREPMHELAVTSLASKTRLSNSVHSALEEMAEGTLVSSEALEAFLQPDRLQRLSLLWRIIADHGCALLQWKLPLLLVRLGDNWRLECMGRAADLPMEEPPPERADVTKRLMELEVRLVSRDLLEHGLRAADPDERLVRKYSDFAVLDALSAHPLGYLDPEAADEAADFWRQFFGHTQSPVLRDSAARQKLAQMHLFKVVGGTLGVASRVAVSMEDLRSIPGSHDLLPSGTVVFEEQDKMLLDCLGCQALSFNDFFFQDGHKQLGTLKSDNRDAIMVELLRRGAARTLLLLSPNSLSWPLVIRVALLPIHLAPSSS